MHETLERLLNGDAAVGHYYRTAKIKWDELFEERRAASTFEWAGWLTDQQIVFFEHNCGGRSLGQEVMAWSGFGSLYSTSKGFDGTLSLAKKLAEAFEGSGCSVEVKGMARRAAAFYSLDER